MKLASFSRPRFFLKEICGVVFSLVVVGLAISYWAPIQGDWVDAMSSRISSRVVGLPVTFLDVRVVHWRHIHFGLVVVVNDDRQTLMTSGNGRLDIQWLDPGGHMPGAVRVHMDRVALLEDFYQTLPVIGAPIRRAFDEPIFVKQTDLLWTLKKGRHRIHVLGFESDEIEVNGGVEIVGRKVVRAHASLFLPHHRFEKIPKGIRSQMIRWRHDWRGVRLLYGGSKLSVIGFSGPFFEARWQSV